MQSIRSKNTATFTANNMTFSLCLFSCLFFFSLSVFLAMELKQIYPSLTIQGTTLWVSAGMQRALKIAHFGSYGASGAQRHSMSLPDNGCLSPYIPPNKTTFSSPVLVPSTSHTHTEQAVGNPALLLPDTPKF